MTSSVRRPGDLSEILAFLTAYEVPLVYSAHLLCDVAGISFKQVADAAGVGRGHLYMMLRDLRPVSASARQAFVDCLGIDPWAQSATASTGTVERENERLRTALEKLLNSDPTGSIATATDDELREAVDDEAAESIVRQQAAAVLLAREVLQPAQC